jgi:cobalt-zinc-cadmium efflux system membrane fusion protein
VEIRSGLAANERYVARGGFTLKAELARGELGGGHGH